MASFRGWYLRVEAVLGLVEALFGSQSLPNCVVYPRLGLQDVVVEVRKASVEPVDASVSLMPVLVRVREGVEHYRVRSDAVPPLSARLVLHEVDPAISLRDRFVFVAVPLSDCP